MWRLISLSFQFILVFFLSVCLKKRSQHPQPVQRGAEEERECDRRRVGKVGQSTTEDEVRVCEMKIKEEEKKDSMGKAKVGQRRGRTVTVQLREESEVKLPGRESDRMRKRGGEKEKQ